MSKVAAARTTPQTNMTRHENRRKSFKILVMTRPLQLAISHTPPVAHSSTVAKSDNDALARTGRR